MEGNDDRAADVDADAEFATWAAEDKFVNDVGAWSEVPGSILFRRRERIFRPIPRSGDE